MANISALKTELMAFFTSTTNLTATEKTKLRNRFVAAYSGAWQVYLAGGGTDTAANRGQFAVDRTVEFWREIFTAGSNQENQAALPVSETL